jgi:hypothetical protein
MDNYAPSERFFAVDLIASAEIELDVLDEQLVGIEPNHSVASRPGEPLGVRQQPRAEPATLTGRRHGDVLDQQVVSAVDRLD